MELCGGKIEKFFTFILSSGQSFDGRYSVKSNKLMGLADMCKLLGVADLNSFHMLLFTYDGQFRFNIAVFDDKLVEIIFTGTPISKGKSIQKTAILKLLEYGLQLLV